MRMILYAARLAVVLVLSNLLTQIGHGIQTREYWMTMGLVMVYGLLCLIEGARHQ